jgi:hypothetical protein
MHFTEYQGTLRVLYGWFGPASPWQRRTFAGAGDSALLLNASSAWMQLQGAIGAAAVRAREIGFSIQMTGEIAIGGIETQHPGAEAMVASPLELEAGLEGQSIERCTDRLALDFQRARRQPTRALRARGAKLDGANDRAVAEDAPLARVPSKQLTANSLPMAK